MIDPLSSVTTIFARIIRPGHESQYENWLAGISHASSLFPGNLGTTILRPSEGRDAYIAITQFDTRCNLDSWLDSTDRARWIAKLQSIDICHEEVITMAGMERWFTPPGARSHSMPPRYKTAALILLGLYPIVLILNVALSPLLAGLPGPLQVLLSLIVSVATMVWIVLPRLTQLFSSWLHPDPRSRDSLKSTT